MRCWSHEEHAAHVSFFSQLHSLLTLREGRDEDVLAADANGGLEDATRIRRVIAHFSTVGSGGKRHDQRGECEHGEGETSEDVCHEIRSEQAQHTVY